MTMTSILTLFNFLGRQAEAVGSPADRAGDVPTVVTAGAGSGKTLTLVGRYVRLLEQRVPLRAIAAITFTEKAAREMRSRIRQTVDQWSARCAEADRTYWQAISAELDAARIGTIHGLCATLLRGQPAEAGLDPEFGVLDENQAARLRAEAIDSALAWTVTDAEAVRIFTVFSERSARALFDDWLAARSDTLAAFERLGADPLARWTDVIQRWLTDQLQRTEWLDALHDLTSITAKNATDKLEINRRAAVAAAHQAQHALNQGDSATTLEQLTTVRRNLKTNVGAKANWAVGDLDLLKAAMKALAAWLDEALGALLDPKQPIDWELDRLAADLLPQLRRVFDQALHD